MQNDNSKITFSTQRQQLAARVLLTVSLLVSGLGSTVAAPGGKVLLTVCLLVSGLGSRLAAPGGQEAGQIAASTSYEVKQIEKIGKDTNSLDPKSLALVLKTVCDNRDKDDNDDNDNDKTDVYSAALNARRKLKERQDFLPVLLEVIEDESQENNIRKEAIKIFGKLQNIDPSFIWPSLTKVIQHPNSDVCEAAVYALGELFQKLTDETERQEAFEALIKASKAPEAAGTTEAQDSKVRWAAIDILGVLEDQAPGFLTLRLKALQQVRMDQNQDINVYAVWALRGLFQKLTDETERQEAFEALIKATKDDAWQVRKEAVYVLADLDKPTSEQRSQILSALHHAEKDSHQGVQYAAKKALQELQQATSTS